MAKLPPHRDDAPDPGPDQHIGTRKPKPMGQPSHPSNAPTDGIPTTDEIRKRTGG